MVDQAEVLVEQVAHDDRHRRGRQDEREEQHRAEERLEEPGHPGVDEHREHEGDGELQGDGDDDEADGVEERHPDRRVGRDIGEILQADESGGRDDVPREEGQDDRGQDRQEGEQAQSDDGGGQEQSDEKLALHVHASRARVRSSSSRSSAAGSAAAEPVTAPRTFLMRAVSTAACCGGAGIGAQGSWSRVS